MIEYRFKKGEKCIFAASGTPAELLADMGVLLENIAFAFKQGGMPDSVITSNMASIAAYAVSKGIKKANDKES